MLALPPLGASTHLVDLGAGTGKLSHLIARAYPEIGRVTLIDPNETKLKRARARLAEALPGARIETRALPAGQGQLEPARDADLVVFGSVLMPMLEHGSTTFAEGVAWVDRALAEAAALLRPGGWLYALETLGNAFVLPTSEGPARRLLLLELVEFCRAASLDDVECVYRFRDRVVVRGRAR